MLPKVRANPIGGNKSLFLFGAELVKKCKQAPHSTAPTTQEKISPSALIHPLKVAVRVNNNVSSLAEREVIDLHHSSVHNARL